MTKKKTVKFVEVESSDEDIKNQLMTSPKKKEKEINEQLKKQRSRKSSRKS